MDKSALLTTERRRAAGVSEYISYLNSISENIDMDKISCQYGVIFAADGFMATEEFATHNWLDDCRQLLIAAEDSKYELLIQLLDSSERTTENVRRAIKLNLASCLFVLEYEHRQLTNMSGPIAHQAQIESNHGTKVPQDLLKLRTEISQQSRSLGSSLQCLYNLACADARNTILINEAQKYRLRQQTLNVVKRYTKLEKPAFFASTIPLDHSVYRSIIASSRDLYQRCRSTLAFYNCA